jgi:hypothetical protein
LKFYQHIKNTIADYAPFLTHENLQANLLSQSVKNLDFFNENPIKEELSMDKKISPTQIMLNWYRAASLEFFRVMSCSIVLMISGG